MRYDWDREIGLPQFAREYFEEIDRRFFSALGECLPLETRAV